LRDTFLINGLFQPGAVTAHYTDLDRMITGGSLSDERAARFAQRNRELGTSFFLERREIGILNLGAPGIVKVGGTALRTSGLLDCIYIGLGEKDVTFESGPAGSSQFLFRQHPAHAKHPTAVVRRADVKTDPIGDPTKANRRRIQQAHLPRWREELSACAGVH